MSSISPQTLRECIPALSELDYELQQNLANHSHQITLSPGQILLREGDPCEQYLFVIKGCLRIQKITADGHEIILFLVEAGQACNLTNACLLGGHPYPAEAIAETETDVLMFSKTHFFQVLEHLPDFRQQIFSSIELGMGLLVTLVKDVAFGHMDQRLAQLLLKRAGPKQRLRTTHHDLAVELGTAREVVSRLLKEFERHNWVKLHRGVIEISNGQALHRINQHNDM